MAEIKIGRTTLNVEACKELGKTKFKAIHKDLFDTDKAWERIENETKPLMTVKTRGRKKQR